MTEDKKIMSVLIGFILMITGIGFAIFSLQLFSSENVDRIVLWIPIITLLAIFITGGTLLTDGFSSEINNTKENPEVKEEKREVKEEKPG